MKIIENIKNILGDNTSMSNKEKFEEEFGPPDSDSENESEDEESETAAVKSKKKSKKRKEGLDKPEDWKALFKGVADSFNFIAMIGPTPRKFNYLPRMTLDVAASDRQTPFIHPYHFYRKMFLSDCLK